jgi:hypothetical protein
MLLFSSYLYQRARDGTAIGSSHTEWPPAPNGRT